MYDFKEVMHIGSHLLTDTDIQGEMGASSSWNPLRSFTFIQNIPQHKGRGGGSSVVTCPKPSSTPF